MVQHRQGRGPLAKRVAQQLDYAYLDTGAMYRTVGVLAMESGLSLSDEKAVAVVAEYTVFRFKWEGGALQIWGNGRDMSAVIRTETAGKAASDVAVHPAVRSALVAQQQKLAEAGGVVMDGRDIGTVVLPRAELKIYLDASPEERARRRFLELQAKGLKISQTDVLAQIKERDRQDSNRATSPLCAADDAIIIDSTDLSAQTVCDRVVELARQRLAEGGLPG